MIFMEQKQFPYHIIWAVLILALVIFGYSFLVSGKQTVLPDKVIVKQPGQNMTQNVSVLTKPIDVTIIGISDTRCPKCDNDVSVIVSIVNSADSFRFNIKGILELNQTDPRAQALIKEYNITRLPTILLNKEVQANKEFTSTWLSHLGTQEADGTFVMRDKFAPFVENESVFGIVDLTVIKDVECVDCVDLSMFINSLTLDNEYQTVIGTITEVNSSSVEGKKLLQTYSIEKTPTIIFSKDIEWYSPAKSLFNLTRQEEDGSYVYRDVYPPYRNLVTGEVIGRVDAFEIVDSECSDCYDPKVILDTLSFNDNGYFLKFNPSRRIDINSEEGKALNAKYHFDFVPTLLLSPEAKEYSAFEKRLDSFGTQEQDGWFVFRNKKALGNLTVRMMPQ